MLDLSYFNLGFRSDSVSNLLNELQETDSADIGLLNDAVLIISDCLQVKENDDLISSFAVSRGYEMNTLLPLLAELYYDQNVSNIVSELKKIYKVIEKIKSDRKAATKTEYSKAIAFFSNLAKVCLSNSAYQLNTEQMSLL